MLSSREDQQTRVRQQADLAALCTSFCVLLDAAGVPTPPDRIGRFATAVTDLQPDTAIALRWIARITLVGSRAQQSILDAVFDQVFVGLIDNATRGGEHAPTMPKDVLPSNRKKPKDNQDDASQPGSPPNGVPGSSSDQSADSETVSESVQMTASIDERLKNKDFGSCTSQELLELAALIGNLSLQPPIRRSHRRRAAANGSHYDLRRTIRSARRHGGDPVFLHRKARVVRERRVVLIADISGSMEKYTRAYLYLLHATVRALTAEAFLFSTKLTRATTALRHHSPEVALHRAGEAAKDWSGGTRIGDALSEFLNGWGRRGLARGAIIVIISDGWEGGDAQHLGEQMARLSRLAHRIVWVNPRKQHAEYQPLVAGMAAALPHIDTFISGHSYESMREVARAIAT
jgi:uncharacterized protein